MTSPALRPNPKLRETSSWIVYDLANTIYSATVTYLLARYVTGPAHIGITTFAGMIVAGLGTPLFASLADRTGRAGAYCTTTTLVCIGCLAYFGIGARDSLGLLAAYFVATVCYQAALVFYNALLPSVASPKHTGLVSGLGVGLGYLGTVFALVILLPVKAAYGWRPAFFVGALAFLVMALPFMIWVRDKRRIARKKFSFAVVKEQWGELLQTIRRLPSRRPLMWFLIGNFFAVDVLNTAILFFGRLLQDSFQHRIDSGRLAVFGFSITSMETFQMIAGLSVTFPALAFGLLLGYLADRIGPRRAYFLSVTGLAVGLYSAALFAGVSATFFLIAICGFGGVGLAGIWTAGRKLLIDLVPGEQVGRYFGIYGITTKVSVIGSVVCGVLLSARGPVHAILSQVAALLIAFFCLYRMRRSET